MRFDISLESKQLKFDSDLRGLRIHGVDYLSGRDGVLIYDQTRDVMGDIVEVQMSTNTSTLIPALRVLGIPYAPYFDERPVVDSQNDITRVSIRVPRFSSGTDVSRATTLASVVRDANSMWNAIAPFISFTDLLGLSCSVDLRTCTAPCNPFREKLSAIHVPLVT